MRAAILCAHQSLRSKRSRSASGRLARTCCIDSSTRAFTAKKRTYARFIRSVLPASSPRVRRTWSASTMNAWKSSISSSTSACRLAKYL